MYPLISAETLDAMSTALNFRDAVLYESDIRLFSPPGWLNDACLNFGLRWIETQVDDDSILLMDPAVYSFMMLQCIEDDEIKELRTSLRLAEKRSVLIPINDASDFGSHRGSHWSLISFFRDEGVAEHYDSLATPSVNLAHARRAVEKLCRVIGVTTCEVRGVTTPQQTNGYDCGAYVLAAVNILVSLRPSAESRAALLNAHLSANAVSDFRETLAAAARELAENNCRLST